MYEVVLSDSISDLEFEFEDTDCIPMIGFITSALSHRLNDEVIATIYVKEREDSCLDSLKSDT